MNKYIGVRLAGRYEIQEQVGIGGMANVYKAKDLIDDITVAVKILKDEYIQNEEFLRRFRNEAKAIAGLSHPNIVKVYDVIYNDDVPAIVMEYIDGITLKEYIEREGILKWKEALHYTVQVLRALQHAHDKGIVHRDIKPQNIMLLMDGTIKVMDFGIARFARFETKTISGKVVGSVHYISPEQACGDVTDQKTDIYSVGVMLFEMLTGRLPFEADAAVSVAMMQVSKTPTRPRELNDTIPEGLEEVILKAMQKDTKTRYQSAAEMLRDIDEFKKNPSIQFSYKYLNDDETPTRHFGAVSVETADKNKEPEAVVEEEEAKSPLIPILLGVTATVVVGVIVLLALLLPKFFSKTPALEVPELVGMSITEAMEKYKEFDFSEHQTAYNDEYAEGIIFKQEIKAGEETKNPKLEVWVSLGAKKGEVPDVTEYQVSAAIDALKKAGFSNWVEIPEESSSVADGLVVRTFPQRGEEVSLATTVQIFYSVEKLEKVKVPNVLDMSVEQATKLLQDKGLVVGEPVEVASDKAKGVVVYQDVTPETWVDQGTTVTLKVSSGEAQKTSYKMDILVPDFITSEIEIKATLDGVTVKTSNIYASDIDKWSITLEGTGTGKLVIRIDEAVYLAYNVNFDDQTNTLLQDNTESLKAKYTAVSSQEPTSSSEPAVESEIAEPEEETQE